MKKIVLGIVALTTTSYSINANAFESGAWLIRGGLANVAPNDSSSNIVVGSDLGVDLSVGNNTQIALNVAYFFRDRWNVEVLAATPFKHDVNFGISDPLGTGDKLGEVTHLPPTVTINYYLFDGVQSFQPYVGLGLNYTFFFDEEFTSANEQVGLSNLSLSDSFGLATQVGADFLIDEKWFVNASIRWIDIDTKASFNLNDADGYVESIEIDPWVYTLSIGYRF